MDKVLNILSELQIVSKCVSPEIDEIEYLCNHISEYSKTYQTNCDLIKQKIKETEQLKEEEQSFIIKIKDREKEFAVAREKLSDLQIQYESLTMFDENNFGCAGHNFTNMQYKKSLFGIDIEADYLEPTVYQAKIFFAKDKFVIFNCDIVRNTYDLKAIQPNLASFEEVRTLLLESGDIVGFMCQVWKRFR